MGSRFHQRCLDTCHNSVRSVTDFLIFVGIDICVSVYNISWFPLVPSARTTSLEHTHPMTTSSDSSPFSHYSFSDTHKVMGFFLNRTSLRTVSANLTTCSVSDNIVSFREASTNPTTCSVSDTIVTFTPTPLVIPFRLTIFPTRTTQCM